MHTAKTLIRLGTLILMVFVMLQLNYYSLSRKFLSVEVILMITQSINMTNKKHMEILLNL